MPERYSVDYAGPRTSISECEGGEWPRFNAARVAAIEHLQEILAEVQATLDVLRRSGNYCEYTVRRAASGLEQESRQAV